MAPFIKFTETKQTGKGEDRVLRFINADQISNAQYFEETKSLRIFIVGRFDKVSFEIVGDEAADALKVLQSL